MVILQQKKIHDKKHKTRELHDKKHKTRELTETQFTYLSLLFIRTCCIEFMFKYPAHKFGGSFVIPS